MKHIPTFEGRYAITKSGEIWSFPKKWRNLSHKGKWLKKIKVGGYLTISLQESNKSKQFLIHRLVALTYIPNPLNLKQINHKNCIKTDNRLKNLEWVTPTQNQNHASKNGLMIKGIKHHNAKLYPEAIVDIRTNLKYGIKNKGIIFFAKKYFVDKKCISQVITKKTWKDV